jgi:hypothetical protein
MNRSLWRLAGRLLICACLAIPGLRASAIVNYEVGVTLTTSEGGNSLSAPGGQVVINFFTDGSSSLFCQPTGASVVPVAHMLTYAGTERTVPNPIDGSYTLAIKITDTDQGGDATATFKGNLKGYISQGESVLANTFDEPRTKALTLNGNTFTITIGPFIAPGAPIASLQGMIAATITCAPTGTSVSGVTLPTGPLKAGQAVPGTVTLNGPAPVGGAVVALTSGSPSALGLPAAVIIAEGATSAPFLGAATAAGANVSVEAKWNNTTISKTVSIGAASAGGDTNGDGQITLVDAARWLRVASGLDTMPG